VAFIPKPPFPNVPQLPGVPQVRRSSLFPASAPPILNIPIAIGRLWQAFFAQPVWGIFEQPEEQPTTVGEDGIETVTVRSQPLKRVVTPDSIGEFGYRNEYDTSDYPVQKGGFADYNKVANPFEISLRLRKGGNKDERAKLIEEIEAIVGTTLFYQIMTPERTYRNCNVTRYEISRRGAGGAYYMSEVDIYFKEIREVEAEYSVTSVATANAASAAALPAINNGIRQALRIPTSLVTQVLG